MLFNATFFQKERVHLSPTFRFMALAYIFVLHHLGLGVRLRHIQKRLKHKTAIHAQVTMREIREIKNPLEGFYKTKNSLIHLKSACIV